MAPASHRRPHHPPGPSQPPNTTVPPLPATSLGQTDVAEQAVLNAMAGTLDVGMDYPLPTSNAMPTQETLPNRPPVPH